MFSRGACKEESQTNSQEAPNTETKDIHEPRDDPIVSQRFMLKRPFRTGESAGDGQGTARGPFRVDESDILC